MAHGYNRLGRQKGAGFYDYDQQGRGELWPGLKTFERGARPLSDSDLTDRLLYVTVLESIKCLQDGASSEDVNASSISGAGFPASLGGALQFVNRTGVKAVFDRANALADLYGERFAPPALLRKNAEAGEAF